MSQAPVSHLELPNELLFKILAHVAAHSVHMAIISPADPEWHLNFHNTLSSVCFAFREIMSGISSKAFQPPPPDTSISLAQHVRTQLLSLRTFARAIRDPSVPSFSIEALDSSAPQLVQGYSLYVAIVYLRTQASRSSPEIYQSTSATIFTAIITLSNVLYSRIIPREVAVMLREATEQEAELSHIGVFVVKHCVLLSGHIDELMAEYDQYDELTLLSREVSKLKAEKIIRLIEQSDAEFQTLLRRNKPLPCCTTIWLSQLPDVYSTLRRVYDTVTTTPLLDDDAVTRLRSMVLRWAPAPLTPDEAIWETSVLA